MNAGGEPDPPTAHHACAIKPARRPAIREPARRPQAARQPLVRGRGSRVSGALVLDSEDLAKAVQHDREVHEWLTAARDADLPVITSATVLVEVTRPRIRTPR